MLCPNCQSNEATKHQFLGYLPCDECKKKSRGAKAGKQVEFTTDEIKEGRSEFADHIIQPFRQGEVSKEYIEKYGTAKIDVSPNEVKHAKATWNDTVYYHD